VIRQTMRPVVAGLVVGIVGALASERPLASLLYDAHAGDHPRIVAAVTGILFAVALTACVVPARRSTRVSPLEALRHE